MTSYGGDTLRFYIVKKFLKKVSHTPKRSMNPGQIASKNTMLEKYQCSVLVSGKEETDIYLYINI